MQITFRYSHIDQSDALEKHVASKLESVANLIPSYEKQAEARAEVDLERTTEHHRNGDVLKARIILHLDGNLIEADAFGDDIYAVVDAARDTLHGNVQRFKEQDVARRHGE